jgi:peptidoglycan/LPS O-acetylase OafA/YrhL
VSPTTTPAGDIGVERLAKERPFVPAEINPATRSPTQARPSRDAALDYLRAFITVLVVAVHSVAAYALIIPASRPRHSWLAGAPIADSHRLFGFDLFLHFNDNFFMSLMFFVSGLLAWSSLARKGSAIFLRDRVLRLGVPLLLALLLMPPAYYAAYLVRATNPSFKAFWREWLSLGFWPSGPLWFIAMLLAFDALAAAVHRFAPRALPRLNHFAAIAFQRPAVFFAGFMVVSAVAYLPMRIAFGADSWVKFGPFFLQTSRLLHYGLYFGAGGSIGGGDVAHSLVARDGRLACRWPPWLLAALAMFAVDAVLIFAILPMAAAKGVAPLLRHVTSGLSFVICCGVTSFAMLALFLRLANTRNPVLDSLSRNAYGIYLVHFAFVLWLQYALLPAMLPAAAKAAAVLALALAASWTTIAALRRIPAVARVI